MPNIITISGSSGRNYAKEPIQNKTAAIGKILSMSGKPSRKFNVSPQGSARIGLISWSVAIFATIVVAGAFYLYQVNDLATKGYEIKEIESQIQELQKNSQRMKIREVELKSMYNIEKATEDLNLVNPQTVSYLEINGPVAMK
jgi:hypothetical protein